jgi:hypothetical protein
MWIAISLVWSALLVGFLLGAWWAGSRRNDEIIEYEAARSEELHRRLKGGGASPMERRA